MTAPEPRHGTRRAYNIRGCRCDACREANTRHHWFARQASKGQVPNTAPHGTANCYRNHACRCGPCRQAQTAAIRAYRDRKREAAS
jgi:hypothetical protein